ncbi:Polyketide synthase [Mycena sanguinolenta]|uniref:Polyketide synthase n=1 Tax=Mycena sanguinolenta TaxID=230812 RepID=A0A8H6ZD62_9AGAR|nr:Polyketide synthase [Mycena sanguinolenta]
MHQSTSNLKPVAVVGISAEFPSGTFSETNFDHQSFFDFLLTGQDASERVPKDRFNIDGWQGSHLGQVLPQEACFLKDINLFDHFEFGISSKDAASIGVATRKLVEHSFLALLDSGIDSRSRNVGTYTSAVAFDLLSAADADEFDVRDGFGGGAAAVANRIAYHLDLLGPSIPVDTACSSSLTALHLGMQALRGGDCEAAVIGGSQINHRRVTSVTKTWLSQWSILSPAGKSVPFDASADGFGRGEAVVVIVIKLLEDAIRDGDKIYATASIEYGCQFHSMIGSAGPVKTPVADSQAAAMLNAYNAIGRSPTEVDFVECHATGTSVGDPIEANWVGSQFKRERELLIGSVKGNIGHTEITSFLASFSKVCSMFATNKIPPQPNYKTPNPEIHWDEYNMRVPARVEEFSTGNASGKRLVSINSFGLLGANGHAIVEGPPPKSHEPAVVPSGRPVLLVAAGLSPRTATAVATDLSQLASEIPDEISILSSIYGRRARQLTWRTAAVSTPGSPFVFPAPRFVPRGSPEVVFVFSGQGPQHLEMGRQLFRTYPAFRESILRMDKVHIELTGTSIVSDVGLFGDVRPKKPLPDTWSVALTVPSVAMIQMALVDLLAEFGVRPNLVFGHSAGEAAMSYASGGVPQELAMEIAIRRSQAMLMVEDSGGMAALSCIPSVAREIVRSVLEEGGPDDVLELGCYNAPEAFTISGTHAMLDKVVEVAQKRGLFARKIKARVPGHCSLLEPCKERYVAEMETAFSRYSGSRWESPFTPEYMWNNGRVPVKFGETVLAAVKEMPEAIFIEMGPHPALSSYISGMGAKPDKVICPMRRTKNVTEFNEIADLLNALGNLCSLGVNTIDFHAVNGTSSLEISRPLPAYPLASKPMPVYSENSRLVVKQKRNRKGPLNHDFFAINAQTHPDIAQHIINGEPIVPTTGYVEMIFEEGARTIWDMKLLGLLPLLPEKVLNVDVKVEGHAWSVASSASGRNPRLHATGFMIPEISESDRNLGPIDLDAIRARCTPSDMTSLCISTVSLAPRPHSVRFIVESKPFSRARMRSFSQVLGNAPDVTEHYNYVFHPSVLDCCLHGMLHPLFIGHADRSVYYLPSSVGRIILHDRAIEEKMPDTLYSYMVPRDWKPESVACDAVIVNERGERLVTVINCTLSKHWTGAMNTRPETSYEYIYQPLGLPPADIPQPCLSQPDYGFLDFIIAKREAPVNGINHDHSKPNGLTNGYPDEGLSPTSPTSPEDRHGFEDIVRSISSAKPSSILSLFSASLESCAAEIRPILDHAVKCGKQLVRILDIGDATACVYNSLLETVVSGYPTLTVDFTVCGHEHVSSDLRSTSFDVDAVSAGLTASTYDIIIATHTLGFAAELDKSLEFLNGLLVPGGFLVALEANGAAETPGGEWIDYVFSSDGDRSGLRSGKPYHRWSRSEWNDQLARANLRVAEGAAIDHSLFLLIRAQKHSLPAISPSSQSPASSNIEPPPIFAFELSRALELQEILLSATSSGGRSTVWIEATSGTFDGAAATGFARSLMREIVAADVRLVLFDPVWAPESRIAAIQHLSTLPSLESEIAVDTLGTILVPRLRPYAPRAVETLDHSKYWMIEQTKTVMQSAPPLPGPCQLLVKISCLSDAEGGLQGLVGTIVNAGSSRWKVGARVVTVVSSVMSNFVLVHEGSVAEIPETVDERECVSLALPLVLAALGLGLATRPIQSLQRAQAVLIGTGAVTSAVARVLKHLGIAPVLLSPSLPLVLPRLSAGDIILGGLPDASDDTIPRVPGVSVFNWDHTDQRAVAAVAANPWFTGSTLGADLLRILQDASLLEDDLLNSFAPKQLLPPSFDLSQSLALADDKFYLIIGGIGSLGLPARDLDVRRARRIVLTSRTGLDRLRGPQNRVLRGAVQYLKNLPDLDLRLEACDASSVESLTTLINSLDRPLAGCILAAVVLSNRLFSKQDAESFAVPFKPKTDAYLALEQAVAIDQLDFLVAISSMASFGVAGQTNYASANTAVEYLTARYPNAWSLVAPVIADTIGLFTAMNSHLEQWRSSAMNSYEIFLCLEDGLLRMKNERISIYVPNLNWNAIHTSVSESPLYSHLVKLHAAEDALEVEDPSEVLREIVMKFVDASEEDFERNVPLTWYGLDSLAAARMSTALKPYLAITQIQLLGDLSLDDVISKMRDAKHAPAAALDSNTEELFAWEAFNEPGQTLVKLVAGSGIPLIILHGGAGDIAAFRAIQEQFTTPLWAIQPTRDAPLESVYGLAQFYFERIKEERPTGPYRIAGFSASSMITLRLAQLLEANGDEILQLCFVDHFPLLFTSNLHGFTSDFKTFDDLTMATRQASVGMVADCCSRDSSHTRRTYGEKLIAASQGLPSNPNAIDAWEWIKTMQGIYLNRIIEFGGGLAAWASLADPDARGEAARRRLIDEIAKVRAPIAVHIANWGLRSLLPLIWKDLGVAQAHRDIRVFYYDAGHFDLFEKADFSRNLELDWTGPQPELEGNGTVVH